MSDLGTSDVRVLAASLGLAVEPADLEEITHRLNAFADALAPLAALDLAGAEPAPGSPPTDAP